MAWNHGWIYRDRVTLRQAGQTALNYYATQYPHSRREEWRDRFTAGQICHHAQPIAATTKLQAGWELTYHRPPWQEPDVPLAMAMLFEDADLLVIAKPSGLPVLPGGGFVTHTVLYQIQQTHPEAAPVHRLGRGTSGLLVLARSPQVRAHLSAQFRTHQVQKIYRALVIPGNIPDRGVIEVAIGKLPHPTLGYVYGAKTDGLTAWSQFTVLERRTDATLLAVEIRTGRPHQIRIHCAAIGFPLWRDPLYTVGGVPDPAHPHATPGDCGYCLHAQQLSFVHPCTGANLTLTATPPQALRKGSTTKLNILI